MNKVLVFLATALSMAPAVEAFAAPPCPDCVLVVGDLSPVALDPFTQLPGIGLAVEAPADGLSFARLLQIDSTAGPGGEIALLYIARDRSQGQLHALSPPPVETYSVLLAGVGVMGLIARRKSRLRLALYR